MAKNQKNHSMIKSSKLYYPLFILNYFFSFFISTIWLIDYEDGLTAEEKFGFTMMDWDDKIAYDILNIVKFPFETLLQNLHVPFLRNILNSIILATILKFIFKNYKDRFFLISN
jgi:hypothetical protein